MTKKRKSNADIERRRNFRTSTFSHQTPVQYGRKWILCKLTLLPQSEWPHPVLAPPSFGPQWPHPVLAPPSFGPTGFPPGAGLETCSSVGEVPRSGDLAPTWSVIAKTPGNHFRPVSEAIELDSDRARGASRCSWVPES